MFNSRNIRSRKEGAERKHAFDSDEEVVTYQDHQYETVEQIKRSNTAKKKGKSNTKVSRKNSINDTSASKAIRNTTNSISKKKAPVIESENRENNFKLLVPSLFEQNYLASKKNLAVKKVCSNLCLFVSMNTTIL